MRLIEFITIYLAAAAPVGVIAFLRQTARDERRARALLRSLAAGLLFPATLFAHALRLRGGGALADEDERAHDSRIESARRALFAALHNLEDRAREAGVRRADATADATADAAHALAAQVERYTGISLALAHAEPEGHPDERETELARVASRAGEDLEVAGRCVRRRNLSRLRARLSQSRLELLHALAELQDALNLASPSRDARHAHAATRSHASAQSHEAARALRHTDHLAPALLRVYERAFTLFMLLEDERGTQSLTRLLDATRARLYRQHESQTPEAAYAPDARRDAAGDAPCRPHSTRTRSATQSPLTGPSAQPAHAMQPAHAPRATTSTPRAPQTLPTPASARG